MPRFIEGERETVDLHAEWWSDKKDAHDRYLERVVVFAQMIGEDDDWIQRELLSLTKMPTSRKQSNNIDMGHMALGTTVTLLRMIQEMTDEYGRTLPVTFERVSRMAKRDRDFITDEIGELNPTNIPVSKKDQAKADAQAAYYENLARSGHHVEEKEIAEEVDPQGVADKSLHRRGARAPLG